MSVATVETLRRGFPPSDKERSAQRVEARAPVTGAVVSSGVVFASYGDGTVRLFRPGLPPQRIAAHEGAILSIAADAAGAV
ncbi:hypothetical protein, partial [Rubrimonas cliftonensis]